MIVYCSGFGLKSIKHKTYKDNLYMIKIIKIIISHVPIVNMNIKQT